VVHVLDASRAVPVTTSLLSAEEQAAVRGPAPGRVRGAAQAPRLAPAEAAALEEARARRTAIEWRREDLPRPSFTGVRVLDDFPLATLREFVDWTPFFHTWELKGVYPRIFEHEKYGAQAKQLYAEGCKLLDTIIEKKLITARGVYGLYPANAIGDDVELYTGEDRQEVLARFHFLRQQAQKEDSDACRSLADFIAPKETGLPDHLGGFASPPASGSRGGRALQGPARRLQRHHGRGPGRPPGRGLRRVPAQAGARGVGLRPRRGPDNDELIAEKYRGIRPAAGYPACPDHTEKGALWKLLDVEKNTGMLLTESFAMWPGLERQRPVLRAPPVALLRPRQDRSRPGARLPPAQGHDHRRGRALAGPQPQLRSGN
jgi:5-methyltetrahydrofolate--homocysteine methyltransferase